MDSHRAEDSEAYETEDIGLWGEPIWVSTLSNHCRGPCRWISIQQGVLVTSWRWYSAPHPWNRRRKLGLGSRWRRVFSLFLHFWYPFIAHIAPWSAPRHSDNKWRQHQSTILQLSSHPRQGKRYKNVSSLTVNVMICNENYSIIYQLWKVYCSYCTF